MFPEAGREGGPSFPGWEKGNSTSPAIIKDKEDSGGFSCRGFPRSSFRPEGLGNRAKDSPPKSEGFRSLFGTSGQGHRGGEPPPPAEGRPWHHGGEHGIPRAWGPSPCLACSSGRHLGSARSSSGSFVAVIAPTRSNCSVWSGVAGPKGGEDCTQQRSREKGAYRDEREVPVSRDGRNFTVRSLRDQERFNPGGRNSPDHGTQPLTPQLKIRPREKGTNRAARKAPVRTVRKRHGGVISHKDQESLNHLRRDSPGQSRSPSSPSHGELALRGGVPPLSLLQIQGNFRFPLSTSLQVGSVAGEESDP